MSVTRSPLLGDSVHRPFIGGSRVSGEGTFDVECPATREVVARVEGAGASQVQEAVRVAQDAFESGEWPRLSTRARARVLHRVADGLESRISELARIDALCTGRPLRELEPQVGRLPEWFRYFAGIAEGLEGRVLPFPGSYLNYADRVPLGVVAQIVTWNHPLLLLVKKLAPALVTGNTVVVKPSELTPLTAMMLAETCTESGVPDGVVNVVPGFGPETGSALVGNPALAKIDFTGGTDTGRAIARQAAENLVPATLELGGKTPVIVFADVELERAVAGAMFAAFVATGQTCVSGARLLVQQGLFDPFVARLAQRVEEIRPGHPLDPASQLGPVVSERQLERVLSYLELARQEGAHVLAGGSRLALEEPLDRGYFVEPTVLSNVRPEMRVAREEIFGPVVCVLPFDSEDEALELANDAEFGLGAAIWTESLSRAHRVARRLRSGVVWINDHHRNDPSSPWGGFGLSGYGRENGWESLYAYTAVRNVVVNLSDETFDWFDATVGPKRYG